MTIENVRAGHAGAVPIDDKMLKRLQAWEAGGVSRREMQRRTGISTRRLSIVLGKKERRQGNPRPMNNVYAYKRPFRMAAKVARGLGYRLTAGENAGGGSVGQMIEAIGNGELVVVPRADWEATQSLVSLGAAMAQITEQAMREEEPADFTADIAELMEHGLAPR